MIVYNPYERRTYLVNQNTNYGGFDLNVSSLFKASKCEKLLPVNTLTNNPNIIGIGNFNPLPMYSAVYMPNPGPRPILEHILCQSIAPKALATVTPNVLLAPNPASDLLNITLDDETIREVVVYDMKGKLVLSQNATERKLTLQVGKLDQGAYVIEITTEEGTIYHERFVKE